jgi:hypothetical protein
VGAAKNATTCPVGSAPGAPRLMQRARRLLSALMSLFLIVGVPVTGLTSGSALAGDAPASGRPAILLFVGKGTSPNDVTAIAQILRTHRFDFATADSDQFNALSESELAAYRLLIVPGGNFVDIGNGLTPGATSHMRNAVRRGLNYLGICAGAFFAGNSPYNGLNLTEGVRFKFYALENQNIRKASVPIAIAGSTTVDHYWEDGPELSGWGEVVAKYPDGTAAIVQGTVGDGWMVLSGVHPEAPQSWRKGLNFSTPAEVDNAYTATLIDAALNRTPLVHY